MVLLLWSSCTVSEYEFSDTRNIKNNLSISIILESDKKKYLLTDTLSLKIIIVNNSKDSILFRKQNILFQVYTHLKLTDWHIEPIYPIRQIDFTSYNEGLAESLVLLKPTDSLFVDIYLDNSIYKISSEPASLKIYVLYYNPVKKYRDLNIWFGVRQSNLISVEFLDK